MEIEDQLEDAQAEKLALDQLYVESLKNCLLLRKSLIKSETQVSKLKLKVQELERQLETHGSIEL